MAQTQIATVAVREIATRLRISLGTFKRRARETMSEGEITEPQLRVLARLERYGPATTAELARREQITPQAMGVTISALQQSGCIARNVDATDGRRVILHLTEAGRKAVVSGRSAIIDKMADALTQSFAAEELATLDAAIPLIERLSDLL